jgi:hypothetical protein
MKKLRLLGSELAAVVVTLLFLVNISFGGGYVSENIDLHCNVDSANDLHITYYSNTSMNLTWYYKGYSWARFDNFQATPNFDSTVWQCDWWGTHWFTFCDTVHVGVEFWQETPNCLYKSNIFWTRNDTMQIGPGGLPGLGFYVSPGIGPWDTITYNLVNNTGQLLSISNVDIWITRSFGVNLDEMFYYTVPSHLQNIVYDTTIVTTYTLNPGDSHQIMIVNPDKSGAMWSSSTGFLIARGIVDNGEAHFVHQHRHHFMFNVPSLTNWGLIVLLALLILSGIYVIYQRRKGVARA